MNRRCNGVMFMRDHELLFQAIRVLNGVKGVERGRVASTEAAPREADNNPPAVVNANGDFLDLNAGAALVSVPLVQG